MAHFFKKTLLNRRKHYFNCYMNVVQVQEQVLTDDLQVCHQDCRRMSRNLTKVGAVVDGHGGPDPQPPVVVGLVELH